MKKLISSAVSIAVVISLAFGVSANRFDSGEDTIDLVEVIESINSLDEWNEYLDNNSLERDHTHDGYTVQDFQIVYDEDNQLINSEVVYVESVTSQTTSGSAVHEVRSTGGTLAFTLTVEGTFSRVSGTSCTCTSATGSFTHPITSLWRSTPSYQKGQVYATKAYAKMYGTASTIIGANTINYNLYLYCTSTGTLSSSYSQS